MQNRAAHLIEGQLGVLNAALLGAPAPVKVIERGTVHLATRILKHAALRYGASALSEDYLFVGSCRSDRPQESILFTSKRTHGPQEALHKGRTSRQTCWEPQTLHKHCVSRYPTSQIIRLSQWHNYAYIGPLGLVEAKGRKHLCSQSCRVSTTSWAKDDQASNKLWLVTNC